MSPESVLSTQSRKSGPAELLRRPGYSTLSRLPSCVTSPEASLSAFCQSRTTASSGPRLGSPIRPCRKIFPPVYVGLRTATSYALPVGIVARSQPFSSSGCRSGGEGIVPRPILLREPLGPPIRSKWYPPFSKAVSGQGDGSGGLAGHRLFFILLECCGKQAAIAGGFQWRYGPGEWRIGANSGGGVYCNKSCTSVPHGGNSVREELEWLLDRFPP